MRNARLVAAITALGGLAVAGYLVYTNTGGCRSARSKWGITIETCPAGDVRQTVRLEVVDVRRGSPDGRVSLAATASYTTGASDEVRTAPIPEISDIELTLVDAKGAATPLAPDKWTTAGDVTHGRLALPEVPDGDYRLRAKYRTRVGPGELEAELPLYTPARVHVITDRPLYEPGNTVRFRAVVLRARDLAPLDGRPGVWTVRDSSGEVLLEEKAAAGEWGVVEGSFPVDRGATTGEWRVAWSSAAASDEVPFTVEPFTLPRFRVEAEPDKAFYQPLDKPVIRGAVVYSSGAPVANARLELAWRVDGAWPPPLDWQAKLLPKQAVAGANGRFELALPQVPADLQGRATLSARIAAIDPAGDRVESAASVLLSEDGIQVSAVTELGDGLVEGFNNRLFVRVTTPDGRVVANRKITVVRAWQPNDAGIPAELDEDGVASLQIDPGAPVNVVIPARPWRPAPRPALVRRGEVTELIAGDGAPLADQVELDRWLAALAPCAKWFDTAGEPQARVGLRVSAAGAVVTAGSGASPLERCVVATLKARRLPPGAERMYTIVFHFTDPDLPRLEASVESALELPEGLEDKIAALAAGTRDCLPQRPGIEGELPRVLAWRAAAGTKEVVLDGWIERRRPADDDDDDGDARRAAAAAMPCVTQRLAGARIKVDEEIEADALGVVRFTLQPPVREAQTRPQPTTMLGYELIVRAELEGAPATKLRVEPGAVPDLRMRVTPVIAAPGETVTAELIRGPEFRGTLPKELVLSHLKGKPVTAALDAERRATFTIDPATEGWVEITGGGQRALVYVRPRADLTVAVTPQQPRYKPGDKAQLEIRTQLGGQPGSAAVGLFGVDESLGQLVALRGPDDLARVRPQVGTGAPAFGTLDGQALALGRIRGANAAAATVLRVTTIPSPPELDAVVRASARSRFDAIEELTDRFYVVLAELHAQARRWEATAPANEKMRPATMAALWRAALDAAAERGERVTDAYGRRLRLSRLPEDLLALTDPRAVVVVGTRLPEDVENWSAWVHKEQP